MTIRNIQHSDDSAIAELIRSVFVEFHAPLSNTVYDDPRTSTMFENFQHPKCEYFVVEEEGEVLGGCGYFPTEGLPMGYAELVKLYLSPKMRGRGMGKELMRRVIEAAKSAGYNYLYIESFPEFSQAVTMYEKFGFKHIPTRLGNSGHTATSIHMVKNLRSLLIEDTTREERLRIINRALNCGGGGCENCSSCWLGGGNIDGIYEDYVEGRKELAQVNREYSERFAGKQSGYGARTESNLPGSSRREGTKKKQS